MDVQREHGESSTIPAKRGADIPPQSFPSLEVTASCLDLRPLAGNGARSRLQRVLGPPERHPAYAITAQADQFYLGRRAPVVCV